MSELGDHNTNLPYGFRRSRSGRWWPVCSCGHRFRRTFWAPGLAESAAREHARAKNGEVQHRRVQVMA